MRRSRDRSRRFSAGDRTRRCAVRRRARRRVDAHATTARYLPLDGEVRDPIEQLAQHRAVEQLAVAQDRLGVGHLAGVDATEPTVDEVAGHLPLELVVAPTSQVLEDEQAQHDRSGRAGPPASRALWPATALHLEHAVDERFVLEQRVELSQHRIHQLFGRGHHDGEEGGARERELSDVSACHGARKVSSIFIVSIP